MIRECISVSGGRVKVSKASGQLTNAELASICFAQYMALLCELWLPTLTHILAFLSRTWKIIMTRVKSQPSSIYLHSALPISIPAALPVLSEI